MEKLSMGEYGLLVWAAYAVAALVLGGVAWVSWRGLKTANRRLRGLEGNRHT